MPNDREAAVFLHPACARNVAAIIALEHRTGMVAVVRPGDPAPRLERIRRGPVGVEDRAGLMFLTLHGWMAGPAAGSTMPLWGRVPRDTDH